MADGGVTSSGAVDDLDRKLAEMSEAQSSFHTELRGEMRELRAQMAGLQALFATLAGASSSSGASVAAGVGPAM